MIITFAILFVLALAFAIFLLFKNKRLEAEVLRLQNWAQTSIADAQKAADQKVAALQQESQASLAEAQKLIDQQFAEMQQEAERIKRHYETESRKIQEAADALVAKTIRDLEPLRKYEKLRDAEADAQRHLADALKEATELRAEAQKLLEQSRIAAASERTLAINRAKEIRGQADALLNQATRDAGRIMSEAEKRAQQIGGDAYEALRDKQTLEKAVQALWNVTEGYGDRYVVPSHSLLDDLAANFGYTEAGQSFQFARAQSRRMVEQKQASACNYEEADRRDRANRFVVDAFNGRVDAILSRSRHDNYGTLEQEIRDAFSLVNLNGLAFHDARILPAYLDTRLAELKWAVVVHELAKKQREEQRYLKEKLRDEEKARKESERAIQDAKVEEEMLRMAQEKVRHENERALAELSARLEKASEAQRVELQKAIEEQKAKFEVQLQQKDEEIRLAEEKSALAVSNARKTKHGHVYIISNIGSFNDDVFKIGLTRRDNWQERIDELGDASVPFEFDVHGIIQSDDAPELERKLHTLFMAMRVNKLNTRREFFRVSLKEIMQEVGKLKKGEDYIGDINWTEAARATQWKETRDIESSPEKLEKWLARQKALTDRQLRLDALRLPISDAGETNDDNEAV